MPLVFRFMQCVLIGVLRGVAPTGGCGGKNKKASLTDEEIRQRTLGLKRDRPDTLLVSGETVTFDDIIGVSSEGANPRRCGTGWSSWLRKRR